MSALDEQAELSDNLSESSEPQKKKPRNISARTEEIVQDFIDLRMTNEASEALKSIDLEAARTNFAEHRQEFVDLLTTLIEEFEVAEPRWALNYVVVNSKVLDEADTVEERRESVVGSGYVYCTYLARRLKEYKKDLDFKDGRYKILIVEKILVRDIPLAALSTVLIEHLIHEHTDVFGQIDGEFLTEAGKDKSGFDFLNYAGKHFVKENSSLAEIALRSVDLTIENKNYVEYDFCSLCGGLAANIEDHQRQDTRCVTKNALQVLNVQEVSGVNKCQYCKKSFSTSRILDRHVNGRQAYDFKIECPVLKAIDALIKLKEKVALVLEQERTFVPSELSSRVTSIVADQFGELTSCFARLPLDNLNDEDISITEDVRGADYYHGLIPRTDIEPLLKKEGDFLLRKTEHTPGVIILALSVRHEDTIQDFVINQGQDGTFYLENHHEESVSALIAWHHSTKTALSSLTPAILYKPIERPDWLLDHESIKLVKKIGEGAFGEVYLADFTTSKGDVKVAVKTMREGISNEARLKFTNEVQLMHKLAHKNIVKILGIAVHEHPIMLVVELCLGGSLLSHLKKNRGEVSVDEKLRFCCESAAGLAYLEKQNFIHRDIAARNCLLTDKTEVKISNFGMSDDRKQLVDEKAKWLAPETMLTKVYNNKTDIWSFGVLVYEIYAEGDEPYPNLTNVEIVAKIIGQDYRMDMPKDTPPSVSKVVAQCWKKDPNERPTFTKIQETLQDLRGKIE